jgi:phytoene synthase
VNAATAVVAPADLERAYRRCEAITRAQAANFFYGIRLLPRERRRAMCAVYAFARRIDDIGDGRLAGEEKLLRLDAEAQALAAPPSAEDPVLIALADARRRFALPDDALQELIEGVRMDVLGTSYEDFEELVVYCRRVAGGIGRLCLAIFDSRDAREDTARAERLADELGVALQLTNILRDVREDAQNGRVYLPSEDLRRFGVVAGEEAPAAQLLAALDDARRSGAVVSLVRFECARAREWFARGIVLTRLLDRRSAACVLAMAGIYKRLLERIEAEPQQVARRRVSLPAWEKAVVAARGLLGVGA